VVVGTLVNLDYDHASELVDEYLASGGSEYGFNFSGFTSSTKQRINSAFNPEAIKFRENQRGWNEEDNGIAWTELGVGLDLVGLGEFAQLAYGFSQNPELFSPIPQNENEVYEKVFGKEILEINKRTGRDGNAVEINFKDGTKIDITGERVKEWAPNTHPKAPPGALQKVEFDESKPGSKGYKRVPTEEELNVLKNAFEK